MKRVPRTLHLVDGTTTTPAEVPLYAGPEAEGAALWPLTVSPPLVALHARVEALLRRGDAQDELQALRDTWRLRWHAVLERYPGLAITISVPEEADRPGSSLYALREALRAANDVPVRCTCGERLHAAGFCLLDDLARALVVAGVHRVTLRGQLQAPAQLVAEVVTPAQPEKSSLGGVQRCDHVHRTLQAATACADKLGGGSYRDAFGTIRRVVDEYEATWSESTRSPPPAYQEADGVTGRGMRWRERTWSAWQPAGKGRAYRAEGHWERGEMELDLIFPYPTDQRHRAEHRDFQPIVEGMAFGMDWLLSLPAEELLAHHRAYNARAEQVEGVVDLEAARPQRFVAGAFTPPGRGQVVAFVGRANADSAATRGIGNVIPDEGTDDDLEEDDDV